ncbi:Fibrous sheath-interacting protein 2, partial [Frankliniella fusca]
ALAATRATARSPSHFQTLRQGTCQPPPYFHSPFPFTYNGRPFSIAKIEYLICHNVTFLIPTTYVYMTHRCSLQLSLPRLSPKPP